MSDKALYSSIFKKNKKIYDFLKKVQMRGKLFSGIDLPIALFARQDLVITQNIILR